MRTITLAVELLRRLRPPRAHTFAARALWSASAPFLIKVEQDVTRLEKSGAHVKLAHQATSSKLRHTP